MWRKTGMFTEGEISEIDRYRKRQCGRRAALTRSELGRRSVLALMDGPMLTASDRTPPVGRRVVRLGIVLTRAEKQRIEEYRRRANLTYSDIVREAVLRALTAA